MVFELATGDYLFDPKASDEYPRDEDHLAVGVVQPGQRPSTVILFGGEKVFTGCLQSRIVNSHR